VGFAADAEKVGELLVGQSEKAHPIRALDKLRLISTRTPNSARGVVGLALAELFLRGFGLRHARACRGGEFIDPRGDVLISRSNLVMRHRVEAKRLIKQTVQRLTDSDGVAAVGGFQQSASDEVVDLCVQQFDADTSQAISAS